MKLIPLPSGEAAIVDDTDYSLISNYRWHALRRPHTTYVVANPWEAITKKQKTVFMHRLIMDARPGQKCDHADCNGLNNQRSNLRLATNSQNAANRRIFRGRRFKGVHRVHVGPNAKKIWQAVIRAEGRYLSYGLYETQEQAAAAYNAAALLHFGEFARVNNLSEQVSSVKTTVHTLS